MASPGALGRRRSLALKPTASTMSLMISMKEKGVDLSQEPAATRWLTTKETWRKAALENPNWRAREAARRRFRVAVAVVIAQQRFQKSMANIEQTVATCLPWLYPRTPVSSFDSDVEAPLLSKVDDKKKLKTKQKTQKFDNDLTALACSGRLMHEDVEVQLTVDELKKLNDERTLEALEDLGGLNGVVSALRTDVEKGLPDDPYVLDERRDEYGSNTYPEKEMRSFWSYLWAAMQDVTVIILMVAAVISLFSGIYQDGAEGWHDGAGVVFAIVLVLLLNAGNDFNQALTFADLNRKKNDIPIEVIRGGHVMEVSIHDLVVGDLIRIHLGDQIPADGLLVESFGVIVDESSMTGENKPLHKDETNPFLLSGTKIQDGYGKMVVTAVGMNTEWGKIMSSVSEENDEQTPLQKRLEHTALAIGKLGITVAVLVFIILNVQYFLNAKIDWSTYSIRKFFSEDFGEVIGFFSISVTIVVVAVPEGLPLAVTLSLAYSMRQMAKDNALVRHLSACETMGGANTICSDKTGTLTTNKMTVVKGHLSETAFAIDTNSLAKDIVLPPNVRSLLFEGLCVNSDGNVQVGTDGEVNVTGKPTETALLAFAHDMGAKFKEERKRATVLEVEPFNSKKKKMGCMIKSREGTLRVHWKGAPDVLLPLVTGCIGEDGKRQTLTAEKRSQFVDLLDAMANESLRNIIITYADLPESEAASLAAAANANKSSSGIEAASCKAAGIPNGGDANSGPPVENGSDEDKLPCHDLTILGVVGIKDPCRPGVPEAVAECQKAGIMVRMCTGDYIVTAKAIARECGILTDDGIAIEGPVFRKMSKEEQIAIIPNLQVMARSSPTDKYTLVSLLREMGQVVSVTGDGTNDAPALKEADIGLSMGVAGTEIAKEASDIIILDDNFSTIVGVVRWGRSVFENIRKFVQFQMTVNIVALILNFLTAAVYGETALTAVQLLWVNLVMDTLGALALATEKPSDKLMERQPIPADENLFTPEMMRNMIVQIIYQMVVLMALMMYGYEWFELERPPPGTLDPRKSNPDTKVLYTIVFNTFVLIQLFNEISSRDMEDPFVLGPNLFNNEVFVAVQVFTFLVQVLMIHSLNAFANTVPLDLHQWGFCIAVGFVGLIISSFGKLIPVRRKLRLTDGPSEKEKLLSISTSA